MGFVPRVFPRTLWLFKKMEKVNFKNQLLVHLSTVAGSKYSDRSWVNIQSAQWVNIQSARTDWSPSWSHGATPILQKVISELNAHPPEFTHYEFVFEDDI